LTQVIKLKRTTDSDKPPATLAEGETAWGLNDRPVRGWIGTPSGVEELFVGTAVEDAEDDAVYGRSNGDWVHVPIVASSAPANPPPFSLWWNSTTNELSLRSGSAWVKLAVDDGEYD